MRNLNSFRAENLWEKVKWFLTLTPYQRYNLSQQILEITNNKAFKQKHAKGSFRTIQIIKQK